MILNIFKAILTNISILILIAYLLTKISIVKEFISSDECSLRSKIVMAILFGLIGIIATHIGISVNGAIANARGIGVIAGGIMGGPLVGAIAGLIAGIHRYLIDIGGFTAFSCTVATIIEGIIGGILSQKIKHTRKNQWIMILLTALLAEITQMVIILFIARPFADALELVKMISMPMISFNAVGLVIFIGIFDSVFIEQNKEAAARIRLVLQIADQCLPHLRKGLYSKKDLEQATTIILNMSNVSGVIITDKQKILSCSGISLKQSDNKETTLPHLVTLTLNSCNVQIINETEPTDPLYETLSNLTALCAPLTKKDGQPIGTLVLFIHKFKLSKEVEQEFVNGLSKLMSTQLELALLDNQKKLLQQAETTALQSQINPHFLFNSLSTISMFCREKPERARELLLSLSNYFRNTLKAGRDMIRFAEEMEHVHAYVELEKARFENKLKVTEHICEGTDCIMPSFIIQPLVENAIKHGARHTEDEIGLVTIYARTKDHCTVITISDNGRGMPDKVIQKLYKDKMEPQYIGLANVHKRLKSIYGQKNGLYIHPDTKGCTVSVTIYDQRSGGNLS